MPVARGVPFITTQECTPKEKTAAVSSRRILLRISAEGGSAERRRSERRSEVHRHVEQIASSHQVVEGAEGAETKTRIPDVVAARPRLRVEQVVDVQRYVHGAEGGARRQVEQARRAVARDLPVDFQRRRLRPGRI